MPTDTAFLTTIPLFELLDEQERVALAAQLDHQHLAHDHHLFKIGDPGNALYILRSGEIEIYFRNDTGERIVLETARAGSLIGELSLLDGGPRSASALALSDVDLLRLDRVHLQTFLRAYPDATLGLLAAMSRRLRQNVTLLRHTATRNINEEIEDRRSLVQKGADWIAAFSGSLSFLTLHIVVFSVWIGLNLGAVRAVPVIDPFPFDMLALFLRLETIVLSVFVLLSQSRQAAKDRIRADIEYDTNVKAEMEVAHLHEKLDDLQAAILSRLANLEHQPASGANAPTQGRPPFVQSV